MPDRRTLSVLSILLILSNAVAVAQSDSTWRQFSAAGDSARVHGDWKGYRHYAELLYRELNGHPGTILAQARAAAQLHDTASAMKWLRMYAATGLVKDLDAESLLAPVRGAPGWRELLAHIAKNREAVSHAKVAFTVPDSQFVSEDIAYDAPRKRFLLSSIREGRIIAVKDGKITTFAVDSGGRSMMALVVDAQYGWLWSSASGLAEAGDSLAWDGTEVQRYDLATGKLLATYGVEADSGANVYGDMTLARGGSLYFTNSVGGQLYTIHTPADTVRMVVTDGTFPSPQEPVALPDGKRVLVPDYVRGIAIVERATGKVSWLANDAHAALNGIDGMVLAGHSLIVVQNGVNPNRIIRLDLDPSMTKIVKWSTLEANTPQLRDPTHGVLVGDKYYFIATSGWDRFAPDGTITPGAVLQPPVIMVLDVR
jgi:sugar lactone lactonase YvrE